MNRITGEAYRNGALDIGIRILRGAIAARASDIHLKAEKTPLVRIDGELCPLEHPPLTEAVVESIVQALAGWAGVAATRLAQPQVDFSCIVPEVGRFRAHAYRQASSVALALRSIPHPIPDFATLRLPPVVRRVAAAERGLVLVCGATGQGKSTTIASMVDHMNQTLSRHVITIEDPVEYVFEEQRCSFSQREVGRDVDNMAQGLEGAWREDPDVIFVGELRTVDEFDTALNAAESGRLVISTCHAADTARAISRMVGMYAPDFRDNARQRIADSLRAVIAQRLVPRRGARERILATEVMAASPTVLDCIRDPTRARGMTAALEAGTHEYGTHSFDQVLMSFVRDNVISVESARAFATSPADLLRNLRVSR